jgi:hypothetical protein
MLAMVATFDVSHVLPKFEEGPGLNEEASLNMADMSVRPEVIHVLLKSGPGLKVEASLNMPSILVTLDTSHVLAKFGPGLNRVALRNIWDMSVTRAVIQLAENEAPGSNVERSLKASEKSVSWLVSQSWIGPYVSSIVVVEAS